MASLAAPPVLFTVPAASLFTFPPNNKLAAVPPPLPGSVTAAAAPFHIPDHIYAAALDPKVPITIACLYAVTVKLLNRYNASNGGKKPWAISKTRGFFAFIVLHNVFLAAYSAWTWWGMLGALRRSLANPAGADGLAGLVDSVCRLNGPSGLGRAAYFSEDADGWVSYAGGLPAAGAEPGRAEVGRLWNEGLAFYGWIFYLSKFYEVLDTFIILAKGKLSSTLQTYHHAGAMMCMWAGMRYMSAPIWVFVFVNSFIHAMMYTYYTITAFSIRVPTLIKRTLTSLQITQFVVGASYAMAHSFISYTIPVVISVAQQQPGSSSPATAAPAAPAAAATESAAAGPLDSLQGFLFSVASRAAAPIAGAASSSAAVAGAAAVSAAPATAVSSAAATTLTYGQRVVPCISSTGETFAIWLNVLYLAPLTYLFVKFFITSYLRRSSAESARLRTSAKAGEGSIGAGGAGARRMSSAALAALAEKAGWDAARGVEREVYGQGENGEGTSSPSRKVNGTAMH